MNLLFYKIVKKYSHQFTNCLSYIGAENPINFVFSSIT